MYKGVLLKFPTRLLGHKCTAILRRYCSKEGGSKMNQFLRIALLAFTALSSFFIKNTYVSNLELEELRQAHVRNHWHKL